MSSTGLVGALAIVGSVLVSTGCRPAEEADACDGDPGVAFEVELSSRGEDELLQAGSSIPVFVPPQGGVAIELDVEFFGVATDQLETIRVDLSRADGSPLAAQPYNGAGLPLLCTEARSLEVSAMPVAFDASVDLASLDDAVVSLQARAVRVDGETFETELEVRLVVSEY